MVQRRLALKPEELGWENFRLSDPCLLKVVADASGESVLKGFLGEKPVPKRTLVSYSFSPLVSDPLGLLAPSLGGLGDAGGGGDLAPGNAAEGAGVGSASEGAGAGSEWQTSRPNGPLFIRKTGTGKDYPPWSHEEEEVILKKSALPYLAELRDRSMESLEQDTLALLLTIRSYSSRPWDFEAERRYPRPQVCIASHGPLKTPQGLMDFIGRTFRTFGFWPEPDWPHSGAHVPVGLEGRPRLLAAGLSFRRDLYMDEKTGKLTSRHESLVRVLRTVFSLLEQEMEDVVKARYRRAHPPKAPSMVIKSAPQGGV
jgi:hypothetical protein